MPRPLQTDLYIADSQTSQHVGLAW